MNFSVLMSVYHGEDPAHLRDSMQSLFDQTQCPGEIVLVEDGPLTPDLEREIARARQSFLGLRIVPLPQNVGLGAALNAGLAHCANELVARMDTDDLAVPDRFARQVAEFERDPELVLVGSSVAEFETDPKRIERVRSVPTSSEDIRRLFAQRCPVNHPTVMFRKSAVQAAGGYDAKFVQEDYYLWGRMLALGHKFRNLPEPLVLMRCGAGLFARRGGMRYALSEARLQCEFHRLGLIGAGQVVVNVLARFAVRLMPDALRKSLYTRFLRSRAVPARSVDQW